MADKRKMNMIIKILREIEMYGFCTRMSYDYELRESGEIIKRNLFQYPVETLYATAEEVAEARELMKK